MKLDILAFGAHPDDVELGAAGTIAKEISLGRSVGIIDLTQGELGTRGSAEIRHQEATKAKELLGVTILVSDACFLSGLRRIETTLDGVAQTAWRPKVVYHYIQWKNIVPDFVVDITGFMEAKVNAVLAYSSQFYDSNSNEPTTPISDKNFLDSVTYRARDLGRLIGTDFAEGFTCERVPAVESLFNLK